MESIQTHLIKAWHSRYSWVHLLWPISLVFRVLVFSAIGSLFTLSRAEIFIACSGGR